MPARLPRWALPFVAAFFAVTLGLFAAIPSFAAESESGVTISGLTPERYRAGEELRVHLEGSAIPSGSSALLEAFLQPTPLTSAWEVENFLEHRGFPGWRIFVDEVAPSASGELTLKIPSEQMPTQDTLTAGVRGLTVRLHAGHEVLETRSLLFYEPLEDLPQTRLNLLFNDRDSATWGVVEKLSQTPGVTVAAPVRDAENDDFGKHLERLNRQQVELIALPEANADISALASVTLPELLSLALQSRNPALEELTKAAVLTDAVLATETGFTMTALKNLETEIIIAPTGWGSGTRWSNDVTPTSRVQLDARTGIIASIGSPHSVAVIDPWLPAQELLNAPPGEEGEELKIRQRLRNTGMMVGLEDPSDQRSLFVSLEPGTDLADGRIQKRIGALLDNQWIHPLTFSELVKSEPTEVARPSIPTRSPNLLEYEEQLAPLEEEYQLARSVGETLAAPPGLEKYWPQLLAATDSHLNAAEREGLVSNAVGSLSTITQALSVTPLSTVNVLHQDANFPVSVVSTASTDAEVYVRIVPSDPRLQAPEKVKVTVPGGGQVEAQVPVRAVGTGDVEAAIELSNAAGTVLDRSQTVTVRVRPNWEDIGTIAVASVALLLFVFGLARSIKRGRLRNRGGTRPQANSTVGQQ